MAQDFDQRVQRLKPGIGDGGIGQGPQSLGGLQFWRIGGEGDPLETSGPPFIVTDMEARPVLDHNHMVVRTRPHTVRKRCHDCLVGSLTHLWHQPEAAFTAFGTDESLEVEPFVARLYRTDQRLSGRCPDAAQDRLQADPVFVHGPEGNSVVEQLRLAELLH